MNRPLKYPFFTELEWKLGRVGVLPWIIGPLVHAPRKFWRRRLWKSRQSETALSRYESSTYSQNGEDGIIAEIFRRLGEGDRYAVEFGFGDGTECCAGHLFLNEGWRGLMIDGSEDGVARAREIFKDRPEVTIAHHFLRVDNICEIFEQYSVPREPDLLIIDTDGNDYWLMDRILSSYRPRVVVAEYNGHWTPPTEWIMAYDPEHNWDGSLYFGASLTSFAKLGDRHGYHLVGCESRGVNAFFVRKDLVGRHFPDHEEGVGRLYAPPRYGLGFGHFARRPSGPRHAWYPPTTRKPFPDIRRTPASG